MNNENLGASERIIQTLLAYSDHAVHNRPGMVTPDKGSVVGVKWQPVTHKEEGEPKQKVVYRLDKVGKKTNKVKIGTLGENGYQIKDDANKVVGEYRPAGLFPEVVTWMYKQASDVWKLDNEFAAKWASFQFTKEHRDLKVILAALMLVQTRKGDPIIDGGKVAFHDEDYRDIGEAMMLLHTKDGKDFNPKLMLRIYDVLTLPGIAAINREMGFGKSARRPFLGRWEKAVEKWLNYREENPKLLQGLVKAGFRQAVMDLARRVGYKPATPFFFEALRWKQAQAKDGRRQLAIGTAVAAAESWEGLTEEAICQKIVKETPNYKRIVGLVPRSIGITRAVMAAAIEAGSLSNKDLVIATPTIEELGLMQVQDIRERWERAVKATEDMRAANIATRVKSKDTAEKLQEGADKALQKQVAEVMKGLVVYVIVDISGSMQNAIPKAKEYIARFLQAFPLDKMHVAVFNTSGRRIKIPHPSAAGVENAFRGITANGGTEYGMGIRALQDTPPAADEEAIMLFVGDEQAPTFERYVNDSGLKPIAFGFLKVGGTETDIAVRRTAANLGIPCFPIDERIFADPYAIPRTIRALVAATPVGKAIMPAAVAPRVTLAEEIVKTKLLEKPAWAA
jgi:hypothetical protein